MFDSKMHQYSKIFNFVLVNKVKTQYLLKEYIVFLMIDSSKLIICFFIATVLYFWCEIVYMRSYHVNCVCLLLPWLWVLPDMCVMYKLSVITTSALTYKKSPSLRKMLCFRFRMTLNDLCTMYIVTDFSLCGMKKAFWSLRKTLKCPNKSARTLLILINTS